MNGMTLLRGIFLNCARIVPVFVICVVLSGCVESTRSSTVVNTTSTPPETLGNDSTNTVVHGVSEDVSQTKEFQVASMIAKEPLQGNLPRRYVMLLTRSAFGVGTGESRASERDFVNCWLFDRGVATKQCSFREYTEEMWKEIRSSQPGQQLKTAYISYSIVPDKRDSLLARVLIFENYSTVIDEHYWVMNISNVSGTWGKDSLTRYPLPFPSAW
jgi:hypothetical protein